MSKNIKHEIRTAIIVDGGFYRQRARYLFWILWELQSSLIYLNILTGFDLKKWMKHPQRILSHQTNRLSLAVIMYEQFMTIDIDAQRDMLKIYRFESSWPWVPGLQSRWC